MCSESRHPGFDPGRIAERSHGWSEAQRAKPVEGSAPPTSRPGRGDGDERCATARSTPCLASNEMHASPRPLPGPADRGGSPTTGSARAAAPASLHPWLHSCAPPGRKASHAARGRFTSRRARFECHYLELHPFRCLHSLDSRERSIVMSRRNPERGAGRWERQRPTRCG